MWQWHCRNREKKFCDKLIVAMPLLKQGGKKDCDKLIVAMALLKQGEKKKFCDNGIAKIGRKKKL